MDVFWVEAVPYDPAGGTYPTVRACSVDLSPVVLFSGVEWLPVLDGGPIFSTTAFNGQFVGRNTSTRGQLNLITSAGEIDNWAGYQWAQRSVKVWKATIDTSNPAAPSFPTERTLLFDGDGVSFDPDEATLFLESRVPVGPVATAAYLGTGELEGTEEMKGVLKPFAIGRHTNRTAKLINAGKLLFQVHGYGTIGALTAVRERGIKLDQPFTYHTTFAALDAATVPATQIHVHLGSGTFRLGFTPYGDITADFDGHYRGYTPLTLGDVIYELLYASGWNMLKVDTDSLDAIDAALPHPVSAYDESGVDIAELITSLMAGAGGYWDVDEFGGFYLGLVYQMDSEDVSIGDEGYGDFDIIEIDHLPVRPPFWRVRVAYAHNPNVMTFANTEAGATAEQLAIIQSVQDLTDGNVSVYFQSAAPGTANENDLWRDSDDGVWSKRVGGAWVPQAGLGALGSALVSASGAQAVASGRMSLFYTDSTPTANNVGDLWSRPSDNPKQMKTWNGTTWVAVATVGAQAGTNLLAAGGTTLTDAAIANSYVSIGASGALSGAGGGQVLLGAGGLGYVGDLNATAGATWGSNVNSRPTNLAALLGSEGIKNNLVSIGADGNLAGGGGGQVTIGGLGFLGDLNATYDGVPDGRGTNQLPSYYRTNFNMRVRREFHDSGQIGLSGNGYGLLETAVDFANTSGGPVKQRFTSQYGAIFERVGNTNDTAWGSWVKNYNGFQPTRFGDGVLTSGGGATSDTTVLNGYISIGANGALSGAGGGQVTLGFGGLGYLGHLSATLGATWGTDLNNRPGNLSSLAGSEGILNASISIGASGALSGGGGGQVLLGSGGLGYLGDLNATFGASWSVNITSRPTNLAGLAGTELILNSSISISIDGALAGGGGGQVTLPGLGAGPLATITSVGTAHLSNNAATAPWLVTGSPGISFASGTKTAILNIAVTKVSGTEGLLEVLSQVEFFGSDAVDLYVSIEVYDGSSNLVGSTTKTLKVDANNATNLPLAFEGFFGGLAAGSYTVYLYGQRYSSNTCSVSGECLLRVREYMR